MAKNKLLPSPATLSSLQPTQHHNSANIPIYLFPSSSVDILKIDFIFEAGPAYQSKKLCASLVNCLIGEATLRHTSQEIAEYIDSHGIILDRHTDTYTATISVYVLSKFALDFLPLLHEIITEPLFTPTDLQVVLSKRKHVLLLAQQKTASVARNIFYKNIYGEEHPEGRYAIPEDADKITIDDIKEFHKRFYTTENQSITISGNFSDTFLTAFTELFCTTNTPSNQPLRQLSSCDFPIPTTFEHRLTEEIPTAVQTTLRLGFRFDNDWDSPEYYRFLVLSTILGGYFGSRLMSSIREEKGYTYGIRSSLLLMRGTNAFFIASDVDGARASEALSDIYKEIHRLTEEAPTQEELDLVGNYLAGDFLRSIDGIFERAERFNTMRALLVDDRYTNHLISTLDTITPIKILKLAQQFFTPDKFTEVITGNLDSFSK